MIIFYLGTPLTLQRKQGQTITYRWYQCCKICINTTEANVYFISSQNYIYVNKNALQIKSSGHSYLHKSNFSSDIQSHFILLGK